MSDLDLYRRGLDRPRIYVSGPMQRAPYTGPRLAALLARRLWLRGWHPIIPHTCALLEMIVGPWDPGSEDGVSGWLEYDFSMLGDCSFIVRVAMDVPSSGTDREHALAAATGITALTEEQALLGAEHWCPR